MSAQYIDASAMSSSHLEPPPASRREGTSGSYALSTGIQDEERLTILNELYNAHSLSALKITPGMQIMTVGCGIGILELEMALATTLKGRVVATDLNADQLLLAHDKALQRQVTNIKFHQIDAENCAHISGIFDRIHCRFVLSHLPWDKVERLLATLYSKLASGGMLVAEEVTSVAALKCIPPHPTFDKFIQLGFKQFALQRSEVTTGQRVFDFACSKGWQVSISSYQPCLHSPRERSILTLGVQSIRQRFIHEGVYTPDELDELILELKDFEHNAAVMPYYAEVAQIKIAKPLLTDPL
jgi:precorrin-6B methylase 2